jgi:pimeloyl-ACP methyl ester carboxylesterase
LGCNDANSSTSSDAWRRQHDRGSAANILAYPAHLLGKAWGATISLIAAVRQPPLVPLTAGAPPAPALRPRLAAAPPARDPAWPAVRRDHPATDRQARRRRAIEESIDRFARAVLGDDAFAGIPADMRAHDRHAATHVGQSLADGGFEPISAAQIRSITAPTLVVAGARSTDRR